MRLTWTNHFSCFGPDGDLMVYEVWESQEAFEEYGKVLIPILTRIGSTRERRTSCRFTTSSPDVGSRHTLHPALRLTGLIQQATPWGSRHAQGTAAGPSCHPRAHRRVFATAREPLVLSMSSADHPTLDAVPAWS
jgi:hypothetical protein